MHEVSGAMEQTRHKTLKFMSITTTPALCVFQNNRFHRCRTTRNEENLQVGYGNEPLDATNTPIFRKTAQSFNHILVMYTYAYTW